MQKQHQYLVRVLSQSVRRFVKFMFISFLFIYSPVFIHGQNNNEIVTNKTIIDLKGAGISKDIIKTMIGSANCRFETDAQSVIKLKKAGVEDEVITAMIEKMNGSAAKSTTGKQAATKTISEPAVTTNSAPLVAALKREGSGIYQRSGSGISELEPTVYSQAKQSGNFVRGISGGFAKSTTKMSVSGARANLQVTDKKPVFYFVFNITSEEGINSQTPLWFTNASSPNEFMLVKFLTGKDNKVREVIVASGNDYSGTAQGVDDKQKISFKYTRLEKGIYEIYFEEDLQPGEYCFMYAGSMSVNGVSNPKVYDFGVK